MRSCSVVAVVLAALAAVVTTVRGDIPVHCLYNTTVGTWYLHLGQAGGSSSEVCSGEWQIESVAKVELQYPDVAVMGTSTGFWTLVYDEGFELRINGQRYWAYFNYTQDGASGPVTSHCDRTFDGWYHDDPKAPGVPPANWGCYFAIKATSGDDKAAHTIVHPAPGAGAPRNHVLRENPQFAAALNAAQSSWTASSRPVFAGMKLGDAMRMAGTPVPARGAEETRPVVPRSNAVPEGLPYAFDWRNVSGVNYVGPMRDQLNCGSCYAFGTTSMLNARLRILTNNTNQVLFAPQDVVSCSEYAQGCDGGFPYLVSKYGMDFGIVEETCFPYESGIMATPSCSVKCTNPNLKHYVHGYHYLGGFYGNCSVAAMMTELYTNGPIAVSFEVHQDFLHYQGGVYQHKTVAALETDPQYDVNPWEITNHVVLIVGWGTDASSGLPYWTVMNSWGFSFGESGYFRILRGVDECAIESMAVASEPVLW